MDETGGVFNDELLKARIKGCKVFLEDYKKNPIYPRNCPSSHLKMMNSTFYYRGIYCSFMRRALAMDSI